ncbi:MAG: AEC family transporter [Oscillospiraceae bacterium]|nr:AEC family transporter [Oscillospiraceae bacterium]
MILGYVLKRMGMLNDEFVRVCNKFNFNVTLPVMLFRDIAATDIVNTFDLKYVLFCACAVTVIFFGIWILARTLIKDKSIIGAFVQASYRSSAAVLGIAFIQNIYGTSGMAPLMIIGSVPLFNIYAVIVLTFEGQGSDETDKKARIKKAAVNVLKNPIIIAIFLGMLSSLFIEEYPVIINKTMSSVASLASPLALIAIGAGFEFGEAIEKLKPTAAASFIKLMVLPAIFLPVAIKLGFTDEKLVALIIMLGSPTTPSSYIMAKNMNNDGVLTSGTVMLTTLLSSVSLTLWIFLCRSGGYIAG